MADESKTLHTTAPRNQMWHMNDSDQTDDDVRKSIKFSVSTARSSQTPRKTHQGNCIN